MEAEELLSPVVPSGVPPAASSAATDTAAEGVAIALGVGQSAGTADVAPAVASYLSQHQDLMQVQKDNLQRHARVLDAHESYLQLQMENLHEQRHLTISHMKWQHLGDVLRGLLYLAITLVGMGIVAALIIALWTAVHYRGVVVEVFAVPPDLAERGYTGAVVSQKILDRISELQEDANLLSIVAISTLEADWGDELKVEIPETGVSIGELGRYLRRHLGNETRISGEVVHTAGGLMVAARVNGRPTSPVAGDQTEFDSLISRAGEQVMSTGLPHHYAAALANVGRADEAIAVLQRIARSGATAMERSAAYITWSFRLLDRGDYAQAEAKARAAMRLTPEAVGNAQFRLWDVDYSLGRFENAHTDANEAAANIGTVRSDFYSPAGRARLIASITCEQFLLSGNLQMAIQACREGVVAASTQAALSGLVWGSPYLLALGHDIVSAHAEVAAIEDPPAPNSPSPLSVRFRRKAEALGALHLASENWDEAVTAYQRGINEARSRAIVLKPWLAYALARKGDVAGAEEILKDLPDDCYPCLRVRGKVAALKQNWEDAERWFVKAARQGPSLPWANTDWAEMLIAKGDAIGATAQAREAIKRQPKFADAYLALGEALALKGDHADAAKQFEQAAEYAPKWGRAHIQWGKALAKLGRSAEAQEKFNQAEALTLAPSERALLASTR